MRPVPLMYDLAPPAVPSRSTFPLVKARSQRLPVACLPVCDLYPNMPLTIPTISPHRCVAYAEIQEISEPQKAWPKW